MDNMLKSLYEDLKHNNKRAARWKIFIALASGLCIYAMVIYALLPQKLSVQIGSTMPETVYATKKVEDAVSTDEVRERVAEQVPFQYSNSERLRTQQVDSFRTYYTSIVNARNYAYENAVKDEEDNLSVSENVLQGANEKYGTALTLEQINQLAAASQEDILSTFRQAETALNSALSQGVYEDDVDKTRETIVDQIPKDKTVMSFLINKGLQKCMTTNMLYDEQATNAEKIKARENVEPIYYSKGQVVAYKGEVLSEAQFDMLSTLGFVGEGFYFDTNILIGVALLLIVLFGFYYVYIYNFNYNVFGRIKYFSLSSGIIVITMGLCVLALNFKEYLMPISLAGLLTVALIDRKVALINNIFVCGLVGIIQRNSWNFYSVFIFIISTMVGIYVFDRKRTRFGIIFAGFMTACMCFAINVAYILIAENLGDVITFMTFKTAYKGVTTVAISTVLCVGITILFEEVFNVLTDAKLVDLSSTENHALKELIKKAPGTYHHSMLVANLAEAAAKAVGANALLVRVAAYYHDIGKIARPIYFKENQHGDNIHDTMNPVESARIITGHTVEGFRMAQKEKLPKEIKEIILQHHGTTYAKYFYDKAIDLGYEINEDDFKYKGPKPQSKEAAIIMLADVMEAVMRVGYDEDNSRNVIKKVIDGKIRDGQLDECDLSFKDIGKIIDAFNESFKGIYHKRIAYKEDAQLMEGNKV